MSSEQDENPVLQDGSTYPGVPDGFQRLWTPHRIAYIQGETKPEGDSCVFCIAPDLGDDESLVVARGTNAYAVLNLYPYNSGHLLICPYRHVADYDKVTNDEREELGHMTQTALEVLRAVSGAHGFNIGINQGKVAGAGIEAHLHQHVVPRWGQDSNFFPIIAHTKAMPQLLGEMRDLLRHSWPSD